MIASGDLGLPIAPYNLQRIVKPEQEGHILLIAGVRQFLADLLGRGDLRGQIDQLGGAFALESRNVSLIILLQPVPQNRFHFAAHLA